MESPSPGDYVRPTDANLPAGVYRVVGAPEDSVTLLRVGDAEGRRVHAGEVHALGADRLDRLAPAEPPEQSPGTALRSAAGTAYWSLRAFAGQLAAHPLPSAVALLAVLAGAAGGDFLPVSDSLRGLLILAGSLALAYVGGGRL